jgi:hypothetical protein
MKLLLLQLQHLTSFETCIFDKNRGAHEANRGHRQKN